MLQYFVDEYEGPQKGLREIDSDQFDQMITDFDRDQFTVDPRHRLNYARTNVVFQQFRENELKILDLYEQHTVVFVLHQDSERDIIVIK